MHPVLFSFGAFTVYSYGAMVAAGVLAALLVTEALAARSGIGRGIATDLVLVFFLSGITGARLWYVFQHLEDYRTAPLKALWVQEGGLVWYGGFLFAALAGLLVVSYRKLPVWKFCDLFSPAVALAHALGRIGCFLNGCCYGKPSDGPWAVRFPGDFTARFPVQTAESLFLFALAAFLFMLQLRPHRDGAVFARYLFIYSFGRFFIEFFRGDQMPVWLFTPAQWTSLLFGAVSVALILYFRRPWTRSN